MELSKAATSSVSKPTLAYFASHDGSWELGVLFSILAILVVVFARFECPMRRDVGLCDARAIPRTYLPAVSRAPFPAPLCRQTTSESFHTKETTAQHRCSTMLTMISDREVGD
jgi:hypothetical protein